jgi:archaellum component FlaF (FlaF/FlaG flagellin family)
MTSALVSLGIVAVVAIGAWLDVKNAREHRAGRLWSEMSEAERLARVLRRVK